MLIVDSQVHIWAADTPERPWPARHKPHRDTPLDADELIERMDAAGVDAAIVVPPSWEGERNDVVLEAARRFPQRFAAMGRIDPEDPEIGERLAHWRESPGMLGLRFSLHRPGMAETLSGDTMRRVWQGAEKHGIPIMALLPHSALHHLDAVAGRYPGLRIVLDHLAIPSSVPAAQRFDNFGALLSMARYPNVAVKASALPCFATDDFPFKSIQPWVRQVVEAFGPQRVFWGSDMSRIPCGYREAVEMFTKHMDFLSQQELDLVMGEGLCTWLGWSRVPT